MCDRARMTRAAALLLGPLSGIASAGPAPPGYSAGITYYVDSTAVAQGPSDFVPVLSAPLATVSGCMLSTPAVSACGSSTAALGELTTASSMRDTETGAMAGSSESANGYATFRDVIVVRGLTPGGLYRLVPTVKVEGSTVWTGPPTPFTANVAVQVFGADGAAVIQDTTLDTTQTTVAITRTLAGVPFSPGVPFNFMLGLGHAARVFKNAQGGSASVTASYTMRVTGLAVLDAQGQAVTGYEVGSHAGADYTASGIVVPDVEPPDFEFVVRGPEQTMIPNDNPWDLRHTPDEGISYRFFDGELRMWFVGGTGTFLTRGPTLESLVPWPLKDGKAVALIGPSGVGFDANYAGVGSVVAAANGRDLLMFYHAETHPCGNFIPFVAGIGLARSTDGGLTWKKRGQVLSGVEPKPTHCNFDASGVGNPSVFKSRDGRWLYMLFCEWRRSLPDSGPDPVYLVRAPIESDGEPGSWQKLAYGAFVEPGLGGSPTPILGPPHPVPASVFAGSPSISWNVALQRYLMTFMTFHGVYVSTSPDGVHWDRARLVWNDVPIHVQAPGKTWLAYPSLASPDQPSQEVTGQHGYLYFARGFYGLTPPHVMSRLGYEIRMPSHAATDADDDGLPDAWERAYGLDPTSKSDELDSDDDGVSNRQEHAAGTHPRGLFTRYLAEGASSAFFDTSIALLNAGSRPAHVLLSYLLADGTVLRETLLVAPESRRTVTPGLRPGMRPAEFATTVESDEPLVVDRTMRWPAQLNAHGSHADRAVLSPSTTWYLAEGATHSGFDLFYLLQNPSDQPADVTVEFLRPAPSTPMTGTYRIDARSRFTIWVDTMPGLENTDVSAVLESNVPIIVERAMYLTGGGRLFEAGHESAGIAAPESHWFFAEGATGEFFDMFILVANPDDRPATVSVRYLLPDGSSLTRHHDIGPRSRFTIWVDQEDARLRDTALSAVVSSTNGVPVVAERAMWWPGPTSRTWGEAHASPGATQTAASWCLAEGEAGPGVDTYILVANTTAQPRQIRATLFFEDGLTPVSALFDLAPSSRFNVYPPVGFPGIFDGVTRRRFGARIVGEPVLGQDAGGLVVERAMYSGDGMRTWAAGSNALATPCP